MQTMADPAGRAWLTAIVRLLHQHGIDHDEIATRPFFHCVRFGQVGVLYVHTKADYRRLCDALINGEEHSVLLSQYESPDDLVQRWLLPLLLERVPEIFPAISHELK